MDRRSFLRGGLGLAGVQAVPKAALAAVARAAALPARSRTGTIRDVEHVVILMQENRSFDHYLGTMGGVRGYHDRITVPTRNGRSVWQQADRSGAVVTPFLMDRDRVASQHLHSLPHSWDDGHSAGNSGRWDNWVSAKGALTMAGYAREDVPFQRALADAFTVCDAYHCSIPSSTNPNRSFLMTGTVDPHGLAGGPMFLQPAEDKTSNLLSDTLFSWTTYPERLEAAGVDWRIYQGFDEDGPFHADVQDAIQPRQGSARVGSPSQVSCFNTLRFFKAYNDAAPGSPLYEKALTRRPPSMFANDAKAGRLPPVSWICPPLSCSEHPKRTPAEGAMFVAAVLDALTANPDTWSRTALFVLYDENDGFFDHVPAPMPPVHGQGKSNVDVTGEIRPQDGQAYGLGARVPAFVVSPWSRGGAVCSQVFDHTSVIRFLEARFNVSEPNISPWRRAVCGDMTACFDFANPDSALPPALPDTSGYRRLADAQAALPRPVAPERPAFPAQETYRRPFRPTPYASDVHLSIPTDGSVQLTFRNEGAVAAVFQVFDGSDETAAPKSYTVAAGTDLQDAWAISASGAYDLHVLGPVALLRHYRGQVATEAAVLVIQNLDNLSITLSASRSAPQTFVIRDNAYDQPPRSVDVPAGREVTVEWPVAASNHWYDIEIASNDRTFVQRAAGHVETSKLSASDPYSKRGLHQ